MCQLKSCPPSELWLHLPHTLQAAARCLLCLLLSMLTSILILSLCSSILPWSFSCTGEPRLELLFIASALGSFFWRKVGSPWVFPFPGIQGILGSTGGHSVPFPGHAASPQARKERFCAAPPVTQPTTMAHLNHPSASSAQPRGLTHTEHCCHLESGCWHRTNWHFELVPTGC